MMKVLLSIIVSSIASLNIATGQSHATAQMQSVEKKIIVDGILSKKKLNEIDANEIFEINLLIAPKEIGSSYNDTTVIINSLRKAIKQYQQKLSLLSDNYKVNLQKNDYNDKNWQYFFQSDGTVISGGSLTLARRLHYIDVKDINVKFDVGYNKGLSNSPTMVYINDNRLKD